MKSILNVMSGLVAFVGLTLAAPLHAEEAPAPMKNIVEIVSANPDLSTLTTAVVAAGLADTLASTDNLTLFAPNNAAFAKLPAGALDKLLADKDALTDLLKYHVLAQKVTATDASALDSAKMLNGQEIKIRSEGDNLYINDAKVVVKDIEASNGIIHIIDAVLMKPAAEPNPG